MDEARCRSVKGESECMVSIDESATYIPRVSGGDRSRVDPNEHREDVPVRPEGELVVELTHVSGSFGKIPALSILNLFVPQGQITVLLGPNGAGKTTACRVITGALDVHAGTVRTF